MQNLYDIIRSSLFFNKFEVGELIFVEYTCPLEDESAAILSHSDYVVHVLSGKKTWRTPGGILSVSKGQTIYVKKGAAIISQFFDDDFCMLGFFINDDFIRSIVKEASGEIEPEPAEKEISFNAVEIENDFIMSTYFQSMLPYFSGKEKPSDSMLMLKMKELVINLITSKNNPSLSSYLKSLCDSERPSIQQIMEANFCYNLSLEEFARLCNRSLSSFKRDFTKHYYVSPGKWLKEKRLDYSAVLLKNSEFNVSQVVLECGFEDLSHFSKSFKKKFNMSPLQFQKEIVT
jgi:AraC-like DNA-binding protein